MIALTRLLASAFLATALMAASVLATPSGLNNWALESWVSQPTEHGDASFTVKLDCIIKF